MRGLSCGRKNTRLGESKENLKVGQARLIPGRNANDEEGRAKPMRHYTDSLITL
jgi:hypothetical protein